MVYKRKTISLRSEICSVRRVEAVKRFHISFLVMSNGPSQFSLSIVLPSAEGGTLLESEGGTLESACKGTKPSENENEDCLHIEKKGDYTNCKLT